MSNNNPKDWNYFEQMELNAFLQICLFYKDKQDDLRDQQRLKK